MQFTLDEWHDWLRLMLAVLSVYCIVVLILRFRRGKNDWNTKTRDHWYSNLMWQFAGLAFFLQGIVLDRSFSVALVLMTAAVLTGGKALHKKGTWGGDA